MGIAGGIHAWRRQRTWQKLKPGTKIRLDSTYAMIVGPLPDPGFRGDQLVVRLLATGQEVIIASHDDIEILRP